MKRTSSEERHVVEFLSRIMTDRAAGDLRPLREYLERHPGHEELIEAEYFRLHHASSQPSDADRRRGVGRSERSTFGPFELYRELGRGGQGVVYAARDRRTGTKVALKVFPFDRSERCHARARLSREAETLEKLDHPGINRVHAWGEIENRIYLALCHETGHSLAELIRRAREVRPQDADGRRSPQALPIESALTCFEELAHAVHAAHEAGVVHRDVKPANMILRPDGRAVLVDFGLAADDDHRDSLTVSGDHLGTPAYMSAEHIREGAKLIDAKSDVYALGVSMYECLTLELPFNGLTRDSLLRSICEDEPVDPRRLNPAIPPQLALVIMTAIARSTKHRYQTAREMGLDLLRVRRGVPVRAKPPGAALRLRRWSRRNPALATGLLSLLVLLTTGLVTSVVLLERSHRANAEKELMLNELQRLSDVEVVSRCRRRADELWPAVPELIGAMTTWLDTATSLLSRREEHVRALDRLRTGSATSWGMETTERAWLETGLVDLLEGLSEIERLERDVRRRRSFARLVRERSIERHRSQWMNTIEEVREHEKYGDLELSPQLGLIPLGRDRHSGLFEFAHLQSGSVPHRDPVTNELVRREDHGIVLVLIPGGPAQIGSERLPRRPREGVRIPRRALLAKPHQVWLDPFFISKLEMTQDQWARIAGENPSFLRPPRRGVGWDHPVEMMTWIDASETMRKLGLCLPTEAQWEYAARAGTSTHWWTGDDVDSLQGAANVADTSFRRAGFAGGRRGIGLHDGWVRHAPVGEFLANGFGLHDVIGNVAEWCRDPLVPYGRIAPRSGDGLRVFEGIELRVIRGGSFQRAPEAGASAWRAAYMMDSSDYVIGVRPARALDR